MAAKPDGAIKSIQCRQQSSRLRLQPSRARQQSSKATSVSAPIREVKFHDFKPRCKFKLALSLPSKLKTALLLAIVIKNFEAELDPIYVK